MQQQYASAAQLAERFGVNTSTVWRWVQKKILPEPIKVSPGCTRFDLGAVDQMIAERDTPAKDVSAAVDASLRSEKRAAVVKARRARASRKGAQ